MKVVYLFGAGASHACVAGKTGTPGILMTHLAQPLADAVHGLTNSEDSKYAPLRRLANDVVTEKVDVEHVITFLDQSPRLVHRQFAEELRRIFATVLQKQLATLKDRLKEDRFRLYVAVMEMHKRHGVNEDLHGVLTLNYDDYIEAAAAKVYDSGAELGVSVGPAPALGDHLRVLKLHGSFDWVDQWPITKAPSADMDRPLWIPPGIQKSKDRYPFNALWGLARELLDCDVVRIVGCNLSGRDWDLISLLFTTRYGQPDKAPYDVEMIDSPLHAAELRKRYPYLNIRSLLDMERYDIGKEMVAELIGGPPRWCHSLEEDEQVALKAQAKKGRNWFQLWLRFIAEALGIDSDDGELGRLLEGGW